MKIYDCFIFYNELDLLELRLRELENVVDFFVLVEATKTHRGKEKPLYFDENKERFKRWKSKIIHIIVKDMPKPGRTYGSNWKINSLLKGGAWELEAYQKKQIARGLKKCKDDDIIMMSDLDEIPNPKKIPEMIKKIDSEKIVFFKLKLYYYYLNGEVNSYWDGPKACRFKTLKEYFNLDMDNFRHLWNLPLRIKMFFGKKIYRIKNGGWHFSFLGNEENIANKIASICHFENDTSYFKNKKRLKESIEKGLDLFGRDQKIRYVKIDETFPETIVKNTKKYAKYIRKTQ